MVGEAHRLTPAMALRQRRGSRGGKSLYLIGASGHGKVVADIAASTGDFRILGFLDDSPLKKDQRLGDIPVLGTTSLLAGDSSDKWAQVVVAIGSNHVRGRKADDVVRQGFLLATLVHPRAVIATDVSLGEGTVVMAGSVINSGARVGRNAIINTGATIDHDCILGDNVHVSPGASLAGGVRVGAQAHIGIGAVVIQNIRIGERCVVGAGAVVIRDVPPGAVVVGNPARALVSEKRKYTRTSA